MRYQMIETISAPRERVAELFGDSSRLPDWQPYLTEMKPLSGDPGQVGSQLELHYDMGSRKLRMVETVIERGLPDRFVAKYQAKGVDNVLEHRFVERGQSTEWTIDTEFKMSGLMKVMAVLMPGAFKKQTAEIMASFKRYVESDPA